LARTAKNQHEGLQTYGETSVNTNKNKNNITLDKGWDVNVRRGMVTFDMYERGSANNGELHDFEIWNS
jgi:hypothetical protein